MNTTWLKAAGIRALKTAAQTAVALLSAGATGMLDIDWLSVGSISLLAAIVSALTSLAGLPELKTADLTVYDSETFTDH